MFYEITCPACGARYERTVRKAARDREFTGEFGREIAMVALDMLIHHLIAEHERPGPLPPGPAQPEHQRTGG